MNRSYCCGLLVVGWILSGTHLSAARPPLTTIVVNVSSNIAAGSGLHIVGDRSELGSLSVTGGIRMYSSGANQWIGRVAVQGVATSAVVSYKLFVRTTNSASYCNTGNGVLGSTTLTTNVPLWNPGYTGKTVYYYTSWTNALILYRLGTSATFLDAPMTRVGAGRTAGEFKYQVSGIGEAGMPLEFVPHGFIGGVEQYDNPAVGGVGSPANYYTWLDTLFLQDGNIFNYQPPSSVSAPQVISVANWASSYTGNGIPSRGGRVYLPRGYSQNTTKRYPVLYMHDGQNVFDPGGSFGSWSADAAATREITQCRMRETIIVAVNNSNSRMSEYGTPQDGYTGDFYLKYLVNNVKPNIDTTYRTLTNFMDTGNMGSSLGGIISAYIGLSSNVFGLVGAVSPSYWYGPNFRTWIRTNNTHSGGNRIYQDCGTDEGTSMWDYFWPVYGYYLQDGYVVNDDLQVAIGCGQIHNEAAWSTRVGGAFRYLYNPWDEANLLETNAPPSPGTLQFTNASYSVDEAGGTLRIYVSRSGGASGAASVTCGTSNGTATAGSDYVSTNSTLVWTNGDTADKFIDVSISDENSYEGSETFSVRLSGATGASAGSPTSTTVTIVDDDPSPPELLITNPPSNVVVSDSLTNFDLQGLAVSAHWLGLAWSNSLTGSSGVAPVSNAWTIAGVPIGVGTNVIVVSATNVAPSTVTNASDSGSSPAYASGWTTNGGFGFGAWQFFTTSTNVNLNGRFMATNAAVDIGTPAWGLYANSNNLSEAKRVLTNALAVGQSFHVSMDNGFIDSASGVGIALQNAEGGNLWELYFIGGQDYYNISGGTTDVSWTSTGLDIDFELTGLTNYRARITPLGGTTRTNIGNLVASTNSAITLFRAWNYTAGAGSDYDAFFNNLRIVSPGAGLAVITSATVNIIRPGVAMHDGIPLSWWNRYGLGTNSSAGANDDGDVANNQEEYIADTDPTDGSSVYSNRITDAQGPGVMTIQAGPPTTNSRRYDVWYGTNLPEGIWVPMNIDVTGANDGSAVFMTVTNDADSRTYRTGVKIP